MPPTSSPSGTPDSPVRPSAEVLRHLQVLESRAPNPPATAPAAVAAGGLVDLGAWAPADDAAAMQLQLQDALLRDREMWQAVPMEGTDFPPGTDLLDQLTEVRSARAQTDQAPAEPRPTSRPYGDRVPQRQSLHDWAPAWDEYAWTGIPRIDNSQPRSSLWPRSSEASEAPAARIRRGDPSSRNANSSQPPHPPVGRTQSELRDNALAQAVRRHQRTDRIAASQSPLPRTLEVLVSETPMPPPQDRESSSRSSRFLRPRNAIYPTARRPQIPAAEISASVDAYRQRYLQNPANDGAAALAFEEAIKYLEQVRTSPSYAVSMALATRFVKHEAYLSTDEADFFLDINHISGLPESSWLRVGSTFEGSQHASGGPNSIGRRFRNPAHTDPSQPEISQTREADSSSGSHNDTYSSHREDRWPVKVTIQSVDFDNMRLTGEMEAFDVPDRTSPEGKSSITTYLEGEIIDMKTYTLETQSFPADTEKDAQYWRKLMPFRGCEDEKMVELLTSRRWWLEEVDRQWILMRWKEKCFITPSEQRLGLTISGFYYISLRRSDGFIEGLYYDPISAPYQHLMLRPVERSFPTYEFR